MPPAPPPLEDFGNTDLDSFPDFKGQGIEGSTDKFPEFLDNFDQGNISEIEGNPPKQYQTPKVPDLPEMDDMSLPPLPSIEEEDGGAAILPPSPQQFKPAENYYAPPEKRQESTLPIHETYKRTEKDLFRQGRFLRDPGGKAIYVRVDRFKLALGTINAVRKELKRVDERVMKIDEIKGSKDKSFESINSSLHDIQKKLIFIDRSLFKGEQK